MIRALQNRSPETFKWKLIGLCGKYLIDFIFSCCKIESVGFENVRPLVESGRLIMAFWHSRILLPSYLYKGRNALALVSRSADGEIIAQIIKRQGHEPVRGSSTRGGLRALAILIKKMRAGDRPAVIIPDGPQGPRFKVQPGVITLARKTGYPIVPVTYSARKMKVFASWDRFVLPFPFTRCRVVYGRPIYVPAGADRKAEATCNRRLEDELCAITFSADRFFGHHII